jgi:hypothetical protein
MEKIPDNMKRWTYGRTLVMFMLSTSPPSQESAMSFVMLAAQSDGSIAVMPIVTPEGMTHDERVRHADKIAREWLDYFEHGFSQAIVVRADSGIDQESTEFIWNYVMTGAPEWWHLL